MTAVQSAPLPSDAISGTAARLLDEASLLFYRDGLTATTVAEIADGAGILKGSVYYHFESREAIVDAYLTREAGRRLEWIDRALRGSGPRDQLLSLVDNVIRAIGRRGFRGCRFLNAVTELPGDRDVARRVSAVTQQSLERVAERFDAAGSADPDGDARALSGALYGAVAAAQMGDRAGLAIARDEAEAIVLERCPAEMRQVA